MAAVFRSLVPKTAAFSFSDEKPTSEKLFLSCSEKLDSFRL